MMSTPVEEQVLGPQEAARLIFNTAEPTAEQVITIRREIKRGVLHRSSQGGLTTTTTAIADYFASRAAADLVTRAETPAKPSTKGTAVGNGPQTEDEITGLYHTMLKDYFLGIFLQRQSRQYPDIFQRAVLAGQVLFVLAILAVVVFVAFDSNGAFALGKSPERVAVEQWIAEKHARYEIVSVEGGGEGTDLTVQYCYRAPSGKQIETRRVFRVVDGNVSLVSE
jgi:hypothetical protein